jgi:hypothetical protein
VTRLNTYTTAAVGALSAEQRAAAAAAAVVTFASPSAVDSFCRLLRSPAGARAERSVLPSASGDAVTVRPSVEDAGWAARARRARISRAGEGRMVADHGATQAASPQAQVVGGREAGGAAAVFGC